MTGSPAEWAHPQRLADWLGHGVDADLVARINTVPRLVARCGRLISDRLGAAFGSEAQRRALALDDLGLAGLAQQAGLVWHARTIVTAISGSQVRALVDLLGIGGRMLSIRHAALAPVDQAVGPIATLAAAIHADGLQCLAAWSKAQPEPVGQRFALRLPCHERPSTSHLAHGSRIVDALLGQEG